MKKILFTKLLDKDDLSTRLTDEVIIECISLIDFSILKVKAFHIKNKAIIFTSVNGVTAFFKNGFRLNSEHHIYCVGCKTDRRLRDFGYSSINILQNAKELAVYLKFKAKEKSFIHFCGNLSLDIFRPEDDAEYKKIEVYKTNLLYPKIDENYDAIVFFSPSAVKSYIKNNTLENVQIFSIGETTSNEIRKYTKNNIFTSSENTLTDILLLINKEIN